jgi:hypothetical protein
VTVPSLVLIKGGKPADAPRDPRHRARLYAALRMWRELQVVR